MSVARAGVEPADNHEGLSFVAFPFAYRASLEASLMGLEPTISTVTGWRALQTALQGRD